jgi:CubicO group peptidase (beta-lactamase class C family)
MTRKEVPMIVKPGFEPVHEAFQSLFDEGLELGARFTAVLGGETVVDLHGGYADRARSRSFGADTLTPVFSTTKALAAILIARLVDAGRLDYGATVASVWPEFGQGGKAGVTIEQALSHQAGLCGFPEPMDPALWFDWDAICDRLAAMEPLWPVGSQSGYHPVTFGYIAGEIFRRVDGRTMGRALREDLCEPLGLDLWIGLPDSEFPRVAELERPRSLPNFGEVNAPTRVAFMTPWAAPGGRGGAEWRRAEIPSANGHATAESLARLMGRLATSGEGVLRPGARARLSAERIRGKDLVLPFEMSWGAGVMRNGADGAFGPNPEAFGHSGWGGSCAFCDPDAGLGAAYVMNRQHADLMGDVRAVRLINALYDCL